jgi:hypothetical protein
MKFTSADSYIEITDTDITEFNNRDILFNSTDSSCIGCENVVLTLENEVLFYNEMNNFFKRMKASKRINEYTEPRKQSLFYKWVNVFLTDFKDKSEVVKYIYEKSLLNEIKEASMILYKQETKLNA